MNKTKIISTAIMAILFLGTFTACTQKAVVPVETPVAAVITISPKGEGTIENPYEIEFLDQFLMMEEDSNYVLMKDMNFKAAESYMDASNMEKMTTGEGWQGLNLVGGSFDGQGNTISNLFINSKDEKNTGFFDRIEESSVSNFGLFKAEVTGKDSTGILAGSTLAGSIENCFIQGEVSGQDGVGGLVGIFSQEEIVGSGAIATVNGRNTVGGLVGSTLEGSINKSTSMGKVIATGNEVGGLVGTSFGPVVDSSSMNSVKGVDSVGGLIGTNWAYLAGATATGEVEGETNTGAFIGLDMGN